MALVELLQKSGESDFLRAVAEAVLQILMEADVEGLIGAGRHERTGDRLNYRNGYHDRSLDTRLGPLSLRIPKLRQGTALHNSGRPFIRAPRRLVIVLKIFYTCLRRRRRTKPSPARAAPKIAKLAGSGVLVVG